MCTCSERRLLRSPATAPVWSVLCAVVTELFPGGVETIFPCKAYLCNLVRTVEKLIRLRESVYKEQNELKGKVSRAGEVKGLCHGEVVSRASRIFPPMRMRVRKWAGKGRKNTPPTFARACAYAEKYGWLARLMARIVSLEDAGETLLVYMFVVVVLKSTITIFQGRATCKLLCRCVLVV